MDNIQLHVKTYDELTKDELYMLLRQRAAKFIVEQNCVYQDLDDQDQTAIHLWLTEGTRLVAMCRICPKGTKLSEVSIGRVIAVEERRGYGRTMVQAAIATAKARLPQFDKIKIESQQQAQGFYEKLGFVATSAPYMMEGLMHLDMELRIMPSSSMF